MLIFRRSIIFYRYIVHFYSPSKYTNLLAPFLPKFIKKEKLKVSCFQNCCCQAKCNVAPILSWRLTQQEGNIFTSTYRFTSPSPSQHHNIITTISPSIYHHNYITITILPSPSQYHKMTVNQKSPPPQPS